MIQLLLRMKLLILKKKKYLLIILIKDLIQLKNGNENAASDAKTKLEEIQRHDRKLRAQVDGNSH